jgi:hypothetical protein
MLDVWPGLFISLKQHRCLDLSQAEHENVLAVLGLHQQICEIDLMEVSNELLEQVGQMMQKPFSKLTKLLFESGSPFPPVLPKSFLGGSAPRLRALELSCIGFPALPNVLLSTTDLLHLNRCFHSITDSTYIPSQMMVTCLSGMTRLKHLYIKYSSESSRFRHNQGLLSPPLTRRTVLLALIYLCFQGGRNYLKDLVACIDTPLLDGLTLVVLNIKAPSMAATPERLSA